MKDKLLFVIHKHNTTRPHFDFRLEINNTLTSWSIPKGPTLDPAQKRLCMFTTDHDMDYRDFEGVLPEGSYGAGAVMIWDEGDYIAEREIEKGVRETITDHDEAEKVMKEGLKKGELKFTLNGRKLHGSFALVKTKGFIPGKDAWLMIKHKDEFVKENYDAKKDDISARSGKTMKMIAEGE